MKKAIMFVLAASGAALTPSISASPEHHRYDVQVRLLESDKLFASPRLITGAGQTATFMSDDGNKKWTIKVLATPALSPAVAGRAVKLATDVEFWVGPEDRRRATTTILVKEGEPAAITLAPQGAFPAVRVEISAQSL